jgi:hypothetical protein
MLCALLGKKVVSGLWDLPIKPDRDHEYSQDYERYDTGRQQDIESFCVPAEQASWSNASQKWFIGFTKS